MDSPAAHFQYQAEGGASSSISDMPWEIMLELVKRMDSEDKSAWRLVNKAACQAVYEGTTALAPSSTAPRRKAFSYVAPSSTALQQELVALPLPLLSKCSGLEQLSCKELKQLCSIQGLPPGLRALDISGTSVTDLSPLGQRTGLMQLSAAYLRGSIDVAQLAATLLHLTGLRRLDLGGNYYGGAAGIQDLAPALKGLSELQHLQHLNFSRSMGARDVHALAPAIQQLTGLQVLYLSWNNMGVQGARALAPALQHLTGLQRLGLCGNYFHNEGARALAPAIQRLTRLQQLDLSHNHLGPAGITALAPSIKELRALQRLGLGGNENLVDIEAAHALALALMELTGLRHLGLSDCDLKARAAQALAPAIEALPLLDVILDRQEEEQLMHEDIAAWSYDT